MTINVSFTAADAHAAMRAFPIVPLDAILGGRSPLVLAPHPDDESLGCGGLLAASAAAGLAPAVLVVTDGAASHPGSTLFPPARLAAIRCEEAVAAVAALGLPRDRIGFLGLPDSAAPHDGEPFRRAVEAIAAAARAFGSGLLLAPWRHDPHGDHVAVHRMAVATGLPHIAYPVWGMTLAPNAPLWGPAPRGWRLDVRSYRAAKRAAVAAHRSQHGQVVPDSPEGFTLSDTLLDPMLGDDEIYLADP